MPRTLPATLASLALASTLHAQTTVLYVDDDAPAGGDGKSWATAFKDLWDAILIPNAALKGDFEIRLAQGTYRPDFGTGNSDFFFRIGPDTAPVGSAISLGLAIFGGFAGLGAPNPDLRNPDDFVSVLSADLLGNDGPDPATRTDNCGPILTASHLGRGFTLDGVTVRAGQIREGFSNFSPGIIVIENGGVSPSPITITLSNCRFIDNRSDGLSRAAGAFLAGRGIIVRNCLFQDNRQKPVPESDWSGTFAGGLVAQAYTQGEISGCRFVRNQGLSAGGASLWMFNSVTNCAFIENSSTTLGGGLTGSWLGRVTSCLFAGNESGTAGGGVYLGDWIWGRLHLCTFVGNSADFGGAAFIDSAAPTIVGCVLAKNAAREGGSQFAFNDPATHAQIRDSLLDDQTSAFFGFWRSLDVVNVSNADPLFRDPAGPDLDTSTHTDNDYSLLHASPAVDRVSPALVWMLPLTDLDGNPRAVGTSPTPIDIGCYELQSPDCAADANADGFIDAVDYDNFVVWFFSADPRSDLNRDSFTDAADYDAFIRDFLDGCP